MHMTIHPSQWFHHEHVLGNEASSSNELMAGLQRALHDRMFWLMVGLTALFCLLIGLAILYGESQSIVVPQTPDVPFYVP